MGTDWTAVVAFILGLIGTVTGIIGLYFDWQRRREERPLLQLRQIDEFYQTSSSEDSNEVNLRITFSLLVDNTGDRDTTISGITGIIELGRQNPVERPTPAILPQGASNLIRVAAHDTMPLNFEFLYEGIRLNEVHSIDWDGGVLSAGRPPIIRVKIRLRHTHATLDKTYYVYSSDDYMHDIRRATHSLS